MSLLDEWAEAEDAAAAARSGGAAWASPAAGLGGGAPLFFGGEGEDEHSFGGGGDNDDVDGEAAPLFAIETLEKDASHGQGAITAVAAAANVVLLGTAAGALIRYDFAEGAATGALLARVLGGCVYASNNPSENTKR
jgi:hypothetical protein